MGLVILHCVVRGTWSPLMLMSDKLSVTFSGLAEDMYKPDMYKPDMYRRTQGFIELHLKMQRKHVMDNITASQS